MRRGTQAKAGAALVAAGSISMAFAVQGQELDATSSFPSRPIRIIVPFTPGGGNDLMGRLIGQKLAERYGRQTIVENRPGAGGVVGSDVASRAAPDGYTLLIVSTSFTQNAAIRKLPYDAVKSFSPIAMIGSGPIVLATAPTLPVKSVKDLVALAKARPGELNYASAGAGGVNHFSGELFKLVSGTNLVHVAYKGGTQAMTDVMSGQAEVLFNALTSALPFIRAGRLKAIGVGTLRRSPALPDVPSISETVGGYEAIVWWGLLAPAGTPTGIVAKLNASIGEILSDADVKKLLTAEAAEAAPASPDQFGRLIRDEVSKWTKVAKAANIRLD
jgi:tripartite-type tricarboxylate transporter receptor subunit TctC